MERQVEHLRATVQRLLGGSGESRGEGQGHLAYVVVSERPELAVRLYFCGAQDLGYSYPRYPWSGEERQRTEYRWEPDADKAHKFVSQEAAEQAAKKLRAPRRGMSRPQMFVVAQIADKRVESSATAVPARRLVSGGA